MKNTRIANDNDNDSFDLLHSRKVTCKACGKTNMFVAQAGKLQGDLCVNCNKWLTGPYGCDDSRFNPRLEHGEHAEHTNAMTRRCVREREQLKNKLKLLEQFRPSFECVNCEIKTTLACSKCQDTQQFLLNYGSLSEMSATACATCKTCGSTDKFVYRTGYEQGEHCIACGTWLRPPIVFGDPKWVDHG